MKRAATLARACFTRENLAAARLILEDTAQHGGEGAGLVQWARRTMEANQAQRGSDDLFGPSLAQGRRPMMSIGGTMGRMFLTVDEAAGRLGVTRSWIYERTRRNTIPHRKLGKFVRFTEDDLQAIAAASATGAFQ